MEEKNTERQDFTLKQVEEMNRYLIENYSLGKAIPQEQAIKDAIMYAGSNRDFAEEHKGMIEVYTEKGIVDKADIDVERWTKAIDAILNEDSLPMQEELSIDAKNLSLDEEFLNLAESIRNLANSL